MLGGPEVVVIVAIGLMLFGPKKLPEMARSIGRAVGEYQKAVKEFENEANAVRKDVLDEGSSAVGQGGPRAPVKKRGPSPQLLKIAKNLGIDTTDKKESQLLAEINRKTKQAEEKIAEKANVTKTESNPKKAEPKTASP